MKISRSILLFALLTVSQVACAQTSLQSQQPSDVANFVNRREMCDHFRGEIPDPSPTSAKHAKEVDAEIDKYCSGTDHQLSVLRAKYAENASISAKLAAYEDDIEGN